MACDLRRSSGSTFGDRFGRYTQKWFKRRRQNLRRGALPLRRFASSVEAVEQRVMLSAISVTTFNDVVDANDGVLSLREAILQANAAEGADTINLQAGTYELAIVGFDDTGDAGDLDVLDDLSIFVSGGQATIDANGIDRVLHVIGSGDSGPAVTIRNVVLTGGEAELGAGLYNSLGTVTLIDGGITGNRASIEAPAYASESGGLVSFVNSPLTNNAVGTTQDAALLDGIRDLIRANQADLIDGVDSVFDTLIDGLDTGLSRLELPLIGNQVREGLQPLFDGLEAFRTRTVDFINDVLTVSTADNAPPLQELLQTALFLALGPGDAGFSSLSPAVQAYLAPLRNQIQTLGLGILNDGADTGSSVGPGDILITLGQDGDGYRWLELGMHLGQRAVVDLPGFDLGLKSLASFIDNPASAAQLEAFLDTFGFSINSSTGLRVDARWDFRLAFGMSELPGQGFYLNAGATTNGLPDGTPIEELKLSVDVFAAPSNDADSFAQQFEDIVTTPNLSAEVPLGLLQAQISDGTPGAVQITAPVGLPLGILGGPSLDIDFQIVIDGDETIRIYNGPGGNLDFSGPLTVTNLPLFLASLNFAVIEATGDAFPAVSFTLDFSPINAFFNPDALTTPFLVLNARYPEINHLEIRGAEELNFLATQYENRRVLGMGFENNGASTLQSDGNQVLTAVLPAPAEGISIEDPDFYVWIGGQRVVGSNGTEYTNGATGIRVSFREILNRNISTLEQLRHKLEELLRDQIAATTNFDATKFELRIVNGDRFELVALAGADPSSPSAAPLLTVTYRAVDQSKLSFVAAIDITSPDFDESYFKDYPNYQVNYNRVTRETISGNDLQDVFVPVLKAEAQLRFHVDANADHLSGFIEQQTGLSEGTIGLPSVEFDLKIDASLDLTNLFSNADDDGDTPSVFSIDTFQFDNITLDVRDFLETVIAPIAEMVVGALDPLFSIIGDAADDPDAFFNQRIPVISDIVGEDVTVGDILEATGLRDDIEKILEVAGDLADLGDTIADYVSSPEFLNDLTENGRFTFGGLELVMDPDSPLYFPRTKTPVPIDLASIIDSASGLGVDSFMRSFSTVFTIAPPGFSVDLFSPTTVFNMLTGQPFNIVSFGLPTIDADAGIELDFEFQDLSFDIDAGATFDSNLRFVYDSAGIEKIVNAARNGSKIDWTDLIDGFAIQNNANGYEIGGSLSFEGSGSIGPFTETDPVTGVEFTLFEAEGYVDIYVELGLELHDPNNDGKLRLDEIFDITNDFSNPGALFCIFDILGSASFEIGGSATVAGVDLGSGDIGLSTGEFSLQDLLSSLFGICEEDTTPILAEEVEIDGETVLRLNTGAFSSGRLYGDVDDGIPDPITYIVENDDGSVTIFDRGGDEITFGAPETSGGEYVSPDDDATTLEKIGGVFIRTSESGVVWTFDSNNRLVSKENGLFGETRYNYGASGVLTSIQYYDAAGDLDRTEQFFQNVDVTVWTDSSGDVHITGYGVTDQIYSGNYTRIIATGSPNDDVLDFSGVVGIDVELTGLAGDDELRGGSGNDELYGGSGDDELYGNAGNDRILAGSGTNTVSDGTGDDYVDLSRNSVGVTLTTGGGSDEVIGTNYDDVITAGPGNGNVRFVGGRGNDILIGGDGNDVLLGGSGDDQLTGNDGNDELYGDVGDDILAGGAGNDRLEGNEDDDELTGGTGADGLYAGQGDDVIVAGLDDTWVDGDSGYDTLTFRMDERAHSATLTAYEYDVDNGTATPYFNVETLDVVLSASADSLTVDGVVLPLTTIAAGDGNDAVTIASLPNHTTPTEILLGDDDDTLTVRDTARVLDVDGGNFNASGDRLVVDRAADIVGRTGDMTPTQLVGLGIADITYESFDHIDVNLGSGHDRYLINDTATGAVVSISGGIGDDRVRVVRVSDETRVSGDDGDDHVTLLIPPTPTNAIGRFDELTFNNGVEKLFIDASQTIIPALWTYDAAGGGAIVYLGNVAPANLVVDTLGIATAIINGGTSNGDSLTVQDLVDVPQYVTINGETVPVQNGDDPDYVGVAGDHVHLEEGSNVASQSGSTAFREFSYSTVIDGLDGASSSVVSPDGQHLYATGYHDDSVVVFQRLANGTLNFVQVLKDGVLGVDGLNGATDVAISADGKHVYVSSDIDDSISVFERVAVTGRLVYRGKVALGGSVTNVVVAPNAANVYATVGSTIVQLTRDATTGLLTVGGSLSVIAGATATDLAINSSGTDLIVATTLGLRRVSLSSGLLANVQAPSAAGATPVTGVAISGSTVYATFDGGIYRYSVVGGLFTYVTTYDVDNSTNRAEGESVAVSPDGTRVTSSFDTTSVNPTPSSRRIRLYSLKVVNEQGLDADGIDEVFVKVDGNTVYDSTQVDEGAFAPSFFASYDALYSGSIEIETWEDSLINEQIGGTYTVDAGKSPGIYTVNFIDEFADITVAEYQLKYEIYDVTSPTPVIQPIVYYTRDSNGGLSNRSYVSVTDVTQLETLTYSADGSYIYGTSFANDRVTIGTPTYVGYVADGQTQSLTANVIGAPDDVRTVLSSDGQHAYSISAKFGVLATYGVNANGALSALPIQNIPLGLVAGSSLVMSSNGSQVYVTNPAEDSLFVFNRNASTGVLTLAQVLTDGLSGVNGLEGVTDIAASWDGNFIYAVGNGESSIAVFSRNSSTGALTFASTFSHADFDSPAAIKLTNAAGGQFAYVMNAGADSLIVLARDAATGALTYVQTVEDGVNGIDGLAGIAAVVLSPNEGYLYVAGSADDAVAIFRRDANSGMLTFVDRVTEGVAGIRGLDGVMQVAVSDEYLFAAGTDALVVFARDATTGKLTLLQRLRDGSSGIVGLERVTDLDLRSDGAVLYVSSGGRVAGDGGVASFDIVQMLPDPIVYDILQSGMEALTSTTADGSDTVVVGRVNVPVLTINTNAETDAVTISEASGTTTINLGADGDYLNVLSAAAGAITTLNGDSGDDDLAVYATGAGATTTVNGGDGDDDIRVTGGRLASTVLVHGDSPNFGDTPAPNPGDTLIFDAHGQQTNPVTPLPSAGTVRIATRSFGVTYDTIENIVIIGSPLADAGGPYTITEGTSLKLDGTESLIPSGHANVSYVWSVGDASVLVSGPSPTLSWNQLVALGIDDNGTYIVALTVRTELNGETFEDIATATLTILNAAPTLSLSGASTAEAGSRYTLALSANDPGDDQIERWIINWGDGTVETYYSSGGVLQHMYSSTGTFAISVTAYDEDGGPYGPATKNLMVISSRSISGVATVNEGSPYTLSLNTPAGVAIAGWTIHWGDGSTQTVTGALSSVTHTYHDDGSYRIWASTIDVDGATRDQIGPLDVLVRNVSPTITSFAASQPILQGSTTTLTAVATDPGADEITFEFDLDGDSFFETTSSSGAFPHDFQKVGTYRIAVRAHDDDGGVSDIRYLTVTVQNVGPSITSIAILTSEPAESLPVRVQVNATDPGGDSDPLTYEFDFDNDGTYEVASGSPIGWHIYPENGDYTVSVRVTDSHGASAMGSIVVQVANLPPTYTAPYVSGRAEEGRPVILGVVASDPAGAYDPLTYHFDFDGDGHYDATSTTGEVVHTFADDGIYTVGIQISDDDGGVTETSLIVNVRNVAPTVALAGEDCIEEGRPFTLTLGAVTDPGADTVTRYIVNWGDGTSTEYTTDGSVTHVYSGTVGTRTITVFLVDEDGLHPLAGRHEVTVSGAVVRDGTLFVVGCHDDDLVTVNSTGNGVIRVHATFLPDGPYKDFSSSDIQRIVIYTNGGDDHVTIAGSITIPAIINGGAGDDHLNGGGGPTVLVGGDGDDLLIGSSAGDILIGGAGVDDLRGGSGEDLLIGGTTAYDSPMSKWTVFDRLLSEWASERSLAERMANIQAGSGPILSDSDGLRSSSSHDEEQTIFDDDDHDRLFGASDSDWLFVGVDDDAFAARGDLLTEML